MKTMSRFLTVIMISLMFISVNTFAQKGNQDGRQMQKRDGHGIEQRIPDLTEKQKADIKKIKLESKKEMLPITNSLGVKRAELQTLRTAENVDKKAIDTKIKEIGELRTKMMSIRENRLQSIRSILTDDQKVVFDSQKGKAHRVRGAKDNCRHKSGKNCNGCKH